MPRGELQRAIARAARKRSSYARPTATALAAGRALYAPQPIARTPERPRQPELPLPQSERQRTQ